MADQEDVSILPSEAQEGGGGVVQAVQGAILTFECVSYDYNGSVAVPVPAVHVHGEYELEGEAAEFEEYYSAGDPSRLRPKKDGTGFQALQEGAGLTKTCKTMQLLDSIVSANGGDEDILTGGIKGLDGINVNMERKPDIERAGLEQKVGARKRTILLVTEINAMPGETPKKKGKPVAGKPVAKAGAPGKAKALRQKTITAIEAAIEAAGGKVEGENIGQLVFRANKKDSEVKAMVELITADDFALLSADDTPWGFDGTTLTAA